MRFLPVDALSVCGCGGVQHSRASSPFPEAARGFKRRTWGTFLHRVRGDSSEREPCASDVREHAGEVTSCCCASRSWLQTPAQGVSGA